MAHAVPGGVMDWGLAGAVPAAIATGSETLLHDGGHGFLIPNVYVNLDPVGRGAFGLVVKADVTPGAVRPNNSFFAKLSTDKVAIKKLPSTTAFKDCYHAKQVYREIVLLKQLAHENLIKLVDLFLSPLNDLYLVTEAMDCDLATLIGSPAFAMQDLHARFLTYQILRGLKYMHSAGVLHRDLKPQNILVNGNLDARICDLGLARVAGPQDTLSTGYVTTRWYRAPEVMLTWQHYTNSLDTWSVGCILAEMLNRIDNRVTFVDPKTQASYFAIFPADSHVEHLRVILETLGSPPPKVVERISEESIRTFVTSAMAELAGQPVVDLATRMQPSNPEGLDLLARLLHFDAELRPTAEQALEHPYLSTYRDRAGETSREPLDTSFDSMDLPVQMWQQMIEAETANLAAPGAAGTVDDAAVASGLASSEAMWAQGALPAPNMDAQLERVSLGLEQLQAEQQRLAELLMQPNLPEPARAQLMAAQAELLTRMQLYQSSLMAP